MRFTSNSFIVSTVALLSLITLGVNADPAAVITSPSAGQTLHAFDSINVIWTVNANEAPDVNCDIALLQIGFADPAAPPAQGILQNDVPLLSGQSKGPITIPNVVAGDNFFFQLVSSDQKTVFSKSGKFTIL